MEKGEGLRVVGKGGRVKCGKGGRLVRKGLRVEKGIWVRCGKGGRVNGWLKGEGLRIGKRGWVKRGGEKGWVKGERLRVVGQRLRVAKGGGLRVVGTG